MLNRNANSHFALNPTSIDMSRSTFDRNHTVKLSFNAGDVIPFYVDEVLPGDTHQVRTSKVIRMPSLITPVMDNIVLDTFFFFVPSRLCWDHWKEFMGENTQSAWIPTTDYTIPQITAPSGGWKVGTIADYFGIPTGVENISVSALPFRAYALIMNEWFRDQNLTDPLNIDTGDSTVTGVNTGDYVKDVAKGGLPFKASKFHDYFTSALPSPQKGPSVGISVDGVFPVTTSANDASGYVVRDPNPTGLRGSFGAPWTSVTPYMVYAQKGDEPGALHDSFVPTNLVVDTSIPFISEQGEIVTSSGFGFSINELRTAFQIQKFYEKQARGGSRYIEVLKSHFGVTSPDARLQRPEYLGGNRIPIMVNQVVQNSGTQDGSTPQGNTAAYSLTSDSHGEFIKSFTEHGFVIGLMVARYDHSYQQGIEKMWSRKTMFDYYWPVFANLGEQAILNKEIFAQGTSEDEEVFGYQEAWADYRYKPSKVVGQMRSQYAQSLDSWHLGDDYSTLPTLSDEWIREDPGNIDRIIAVSSEVAHQFFGDVYVENRATRVMPMYSIPGLIDHH